MSQAPSCPIRLGGRRYRRRALPLSAIREQELAAPLPEAIDLDALQTAARFDGDEFTYFQANKLDSIPRRQIGPHLGWGTAKVEAVRVRVQRKLRVFRKGADVNDFVIRGDSRHLSFEENLASGQRVWSLAPLARGFKSIMAAEMVNVCGDRPTAARSETKAA